MVEPAPELLVPRPALLPLFPKGSTFPAGLSRRLVYMPAESSSEMQDERAIPGLLYPHSANLILVVPTWSWHIWR